MACLDAIGPRFLAWLAAFCCLFLSAAASAGAAPNPDTVAFRVADYAAPTAFARGPDGALWFAGRQPESLIFGTVSSSGPKLLREVPIGRVEAEPTIAVGSDGNLWFTDQYNNAIGRLNANGTSSSYPLPTGDGPTGIVAGPGEFLWFAEPNADRVGRISASGEITEFELKSGAEPTAVAEGPDGALWIVERGAGRIARMTASGSVTAEYALPNQAGRPYAIVAGHGPYLWFSQEGAPRIGRIGTDGAIEEFRVPGDNGTRELVLAADGNLWFSAGSAIGSISPAGETGEPECIDRTCNYPINALAEGPEGGVWFATGALQLPLQTGGGAYQLAAIQGGLVGRFYAPRLELRLGKRPTRVKDGLTTVALSCHGGSAGESCGGWLRLSAKLGGRRVTLDRHRYRLEPASGRRLPLLLGRRGRLALYRGKRLRVQVSASLADGSGARRNFVLQASGRR